jgi:hypothetical protein
MRLASRSAGGSLAAPLRLVAVWLRAKWAPPLARLAVGREGEGERVIDLSEGADESQGCSDSRSLEWALRLGLKRPRILRICVVFAKKSFCSAHS